MVATEPGYPQFMPLSPRVLVVEDDLELRLVLMRGLEEEGFSTTGFGTGRELLDGCSAETAEWIAPLAADSSASARIGTVGADHRERCGRSSRSQCSLAKMATKTSTAPAATISRCHRGCPPLRSRAAAAIANMIYVWRCAAGSTDAA